MNLKNYIFLLLAALSVLNVFAQNKKVAVKNLALYDSSFVQYWGYLDNWGVQISEDSIIVGGDQSEPILIPTKLPLNQTLQYYCEKEGVYWTLDVMRITYTDIKFSIVGLKSDSLLFQGTGKAVLSPTFYLGCAGVYEKSDEETFGLNNYTFEGGDFESGAMLIPEQTNEMIGYSHRINEQKLVLNFLRDEK